jgi:hypothetical protein
MNVSPQIPISVWSFLMEQARASLNTPYLPGSDQGERLRALYQKWENRMFRIEQYEPRTHDEAILLAAMHYGVVIHLSSSPLMEYTHLVMSIADHAARSRSQVWGCVRYTHPVDQVLAAWTQRFPHALSLAHLFHPVFPVELIPQDAATDYAERMGKSATHESHVMTTYEYIQFRAVSPHFYSGIPMRPLNSKTYVTLSDVSALTWDDAIAYGTHDQGYSVMTWRELAEWFESSQSMTWPSEKPCTVDACALLQLERLAQDRQWYELVRIVRTLKENASETRQTVASFVSDYYVASSAEKQAVESVLWVWLYLGMSMRGWKAQPEGGESGDGNSPRIGRKVTPALPPSASFGTLSSSPCV